MKADKAIATYRRMRAQPLWRLLASNTGPAVIGLLQAHLYESERSLPASIFHERIARDLEELRAQGEDFPQTAQAYVASWLADGYLERRFPAGASEEEYELSTATVEAIRFVSGLEQPHSAATESRLTLVIEALARLAEDTDTDKFRRIDRLMPAVNKSASNRSGYAGMWHGMPYRQVFDDPGSGRSVVSENR